MTASVLEVTTSSEPADVRKGARRLPARLLAPGFVVSALILIVAFAWAFAPGLFATFPPNEGIPTDRLLPPSTTYWFGTDYLGRDLYSRTVYAASLSLVATGIAVAIAVVVGSTLGIIAGYARGIADVIISRFVDVLLAIPGLLLSMAIIAALGFGTINVAIAVGVGAVASFARVTRAEVLRIRHVDYIEAAAGSGLGVVGILVRHILPNSWGPVFAMAVIEFGAAVLAVSALSFLGYGAQPPTPEWGSLIAEGRNHLSTSWWLITLPGLVVVALVLSTNRVAAAIGSETHG
ncbi:ABC transporter permease [Microbacterium sp. 18062]|uniref:ABC transporter permease n=1 Tax=Microbacterium sp. 18062 TaxID=2681410 RepID=UPI00135B1876|nr:ABC transporter permease [Microbacterium sp. 18062]